MASEEEEMSHAKIGRNQVPAQQRQARVRAAGGRAGAAVGEQLWSAASRRCGPLAVLVLALALVTAAVAHAGQEPTRSAEQTAEQEPEQAAEQQTVPLPEFAWPLVEFACHESSSPPFFERCISTWIVPKPGEAPSAGEGGSAAGSPWSWVAAEALTEAVKAAVEAVLPSSQLEEIHNSVRYVSAGLNRIDETLEDVDETLQGIDATLRDVNETQQEMVEALGGITAALQTLEERLAATEEEEAAARP